MDSARPNRDDDTALAAIDAFAGPALLVGGVEHTIHHTNEQARHLLQLDTEWVTGLSAELASDRLSRTGTYRSIVKGDVHPHVIEWTAAFLPSGDTALFGRNVTLERRLRVALMESRQRYKDFVDLACHFAWETDAEGRFAFLSSEQALGFATEALLKRQPAELLAEDSDGPPLPFSARTRVHEVPVWLHAADQQSLCMAVSAIPLYSEDGRWAGARGVARDVTQQVHQSYALAQQHMDERLIGRIDHALHKSLNADEAISEAVTDIVHVFDASGCMIIRRGKPDYRPFVAKSGSLPVDATAFADRVMQAGRSESRSDAAGRLLGTPTRHGNEMNGAVVVIRPVSAIPWRDEDQTLLEDLASRIGSVNAMALHTERLRRLSECDGLTGLLNRRTFLDRLHEHTRNRDGGRSALLYLDLDNFKPVNDVLGHAQGDLVLKRFGTLLMNGSRPGDLACRLGGDEFALWIARSEEAQACIVAKRMIAGVARLEAFSADRARPLGVSIGIALSTPTSGEPVELLLERADHAMYRAKHQGKSRIAVAPPYDRDDKGPSDDGV